MGICEALVQEDGDGIVGPETPSHLFLFLWLLGIEPRPSKPSEAGGLGKARQRGDQPTTRHT